MLLRMSLQGRYLFPLAAVGPKEAKRLRGRLGHEQEPPSSEYCQEGSRWYPFQVPEDVPLHQPCGAASLSIQLVVLVLLARRHSQQ